MDNRNKIVRLNRTKNAVRNMASGIINKLVTLLFPFVLRTVLIHVMGREYAGLDGLFVSILEVLNLTELGLGTAIVYCMYKPIAQGDDNTICALLKLFRKLYFAIGMVVLVIGLAIMPFLEYFIKDSYPADLNLYILYGVYLFNSCVSYFFMGYRSAILSAYQRLDVTQNIATMIKGIMFLIQIVVLLMFRNYYAYVILIPIFTIVLNGITAYESRKMFPQYVCRGQVPREVVSDLKEKVSGLMITRLCAITRNSFDSIFISAFIGLAISAIYANYYLIMFSVTTLLGIAVQAVLAGVGNSIQTESVEQNYSDLKRFNFMYLWIAGVCTVCLLCLYQPFMELWMGRENMLPMSSVVLFCMYFFLLKIGDIQSVYYNAAGLWWNYKTCTIVEALLNLVLNYILVRVWGLNGVIAGTLISLFLVNFLYSERLVFKYYFKNGKTLEFYLLQIKYVVVTAMVCLMMYYVCSAIQLEHVVGTLILRGIICACVPNLFFYLIYRKSAEFISAKMWVLDKVKRNN